MASAYGLGDDIGSQLDYIASEQDSVPSAYQVTLINVGEIGELIQPFTAGEACAVSPAYLTDLRLH